MTPDTIPHLCGGILFDLLLETRKPRRKARNKLAGGTDSLTAINVYDGLVEVVTGESASNLGSTNSKCVSSYRSCTSSRGIYVPFTDPVTQSTFNSKYQKKDPDLYSRMSRFINAYLNEDKCVWLVHALIETMQQEHLNAKIAINYTDDLPVAELHTASLIVFLPFLLSVLHFVVLNCPDCESGRPTFEAWYFQPNARSEWKFKSDIGCGITPIKVSMDLTTPNHLPFTETRTVEPTADDVLTIDTPVDEDRLSASQCDDDAGASKAADSRATIVHQTIVNQYGDHPIHIAHVENLRL